MVQAEIIPHMSNRTERQHFVPAFYIAQWATPRERTGKMRVFDRTNGNSWPTTPEGVGFARDFYTVELREAPQAVEDLLAKLEGIGSEAIREVTTTDTLPTTSEGIHRLMSHVAMQAARTPRVRENLANFYSDVHLRVLDAYADHPEAFAKAMREMNPEMTEAQANKAHSELREMLQQPGLRGQMDQTTLIRNAFDAAAGIEDMLCQRHWQLCVAPIDRQFVTSDDPVVLDFEPGVKGHFLKSPGFGRVDTIVSFVLGPRHLIMGYAFEPAMRCRGLSRENVAAYNTRAVWNAVRFVYFGGESFDFIGPEGELATGPAEVLRRPDLEPTPPQGRRARRAPARKRVARPQGR
jgi:hypothetical protein